jgi:hypothetical protein
MRIEDFKFEAFVSLEQDARFLNFSQLPCRRWPGTARYRVSRSLLAAG